MGYYQGASWPSSGYYRGAMGDPGFFGGLLSLGRSAIGTAIGTIPVVGPTLQKITKILPTAGKVMVGGGAGFPGVGGAIASAARKVGGAVSKHPVLSAAGAAGVAAMGGAVLAHRGAAPAVAGMRRRKHMRVTNPKALRKALRRVAGFERIARRVCHFTHPGRAVRVRFKFPKKRKRVA